MGDGGLLLHSPRSGGRGALHWNKRFFQKYFYWFNFIRVIPFRIRLYWPQEYFSLLNLCHRVSLTLYFSVSFFYRYTFGSSPGTSSLRDRRSLLGRTAVELEPEDRRSDTLLFRDNKFGVPDTMNKIPSVSFYYVNTRSPSYWVSTLNHISLYYSLRWRLTRCVETIMWLLNGIGISQIYNPATLTHRTT